MDPATLTDEAPGAVPTEAPGPRRFLLIVALLVLALVAMAFAGPWAPPLSEGTPPPPVELPEMAEELYPVEDPITELLEQARTEPVDLSGLAMAVAGVILALLIGWALRVLRRRRGWRVPGLAEPEPGRAGDVVLGEVSLPAMAEGADAAVEALRRPRLVPRDAIIAAWVALEDAAAISGLVRDPADTPTEFTLAVLDATPADRGAARALLALYLHARFSTDAMSESDVAAASSAAEVLASDLAAARNAAFEAPGDPGTPGEPGSSEDPGADPEPPAPGPAEDGEAG